MTLQPMATAPRDGRHIHASMNGHALFPIMWVDGKWIDVEFFNDKYTDEELNGWLDIEALVRDSERLDRVESEGLTVQRREGPVSLDGWAVLKHAKILTTGETARAAIDKEAGRESA